MNAALIALTVARGGNTPTSPSLPPSTRTSVGVGSPVAGLPPVVTLTAVSSSSPSILIDRPLAVGTCGRSGNSLASFSLIQDFGTTWLQRVAVDHWQAGRSHLA